MFLEVGNALVREKTSLILQNMVNTKVIPLSALVSSSPNSMISFQFKEDMLILTIS